MSTTAQKPATPPMPVQLSAPEFEVFILPHLSIPKRGLKAAPALFEAEYATSETHILVALDEP